MAIRLLLLALAIAALLPLAYQFSYPSIDEGLTIATGTTLYDTGLLEYLVDHFTLESPRTQVRVVPVGTGRALMMGQRGDADLVLVHNRRLEENFVREGFGVHRVTIMYNYFVIAGPPQDPAGIKGLDALEAFKRIAESGKEGVAIFVSRADLSGTHARELSLWRELGIDPVGEPWYLQAYTGMAMTLRIADLKGAYLLVDSGTWFFHKRGVMLEELVKDASLVNPYSAIPINPDKVKGVNWEGAKKFVAFLVSQVGQGLIANYRVNGVSLFIPAFNKSESIGFPDEEEDIQYWLSILKQGKP